MELIRTDTGKYKITTELHGSIYYNGLLYIDKIISNNCICENNPKAEIDKIKIDTINGSYIEWDDSSIMITTQPIEIHLQKVRQRAKT